MHWSASPMHWWKCGFVVFFGTHFGVGEIGCHWSARVTSRQPIGPVDRSQKRFCYSIHWLAKIIITDLIVCSCKWEWIKCCVWHGIWLNASTYVCMYMYVCTCSLNWVFCLPMCFLWAMVESKLSYYDVACCYQGYNPWVISFMNSWIHRIKSLIGL